MFSGAAIVSVVLLFSSLNFALTIRFASHAGLLIASLLPPAPAAASATDTAASREPLLDAPATAAHTTAAATHIALLHARVSSFMSRMLLHWFLGFRSLFVSVPFALLIVSPALMLAATALLLAVFVYMDNPVTLDSAPVDDGEHQGV